MGRSLRQEVYFSPIIRWFKIYLKNFDTVIIDEAAQAVEISTLIPLKYGCRRLIMIGDSS